MFKTIIPDELTSPPENVTKVLLCTGKIYYELHKRRADLKRDDVAIIRIEQLYPLRKQVLQELLSNYEEGTPIAWVQEEPENMGAWRYMFVNFGPVMFGDYPFSGIYREPSASPATGSAICHKREQEQLLVQAFDQTSSKPAVIEADKRAMPTA
jgi:2-oxoglutarate dehydrogenase E1 component